MNASVKSVVDRRGLLRSVSAESPIAIELGCGPVKRVQEAVGIDAIPYEGVDIVGDVFEVLALFPDRSVSSVYSSHFFEHVSDLAGLMQTLSRVMTVGARMEVVVPHFSNPFFYSDPTHETPFGLYTFSYLSEDQVLARGVPRYGVEPEFALVEVSLGFKSYRPNYLRHAFKRIVERVVNMSAWAQELYEENLCWICPAYEIRFVLRRL